MLTFCSLVFRQRCVFSENINCLHGTGALSKVKDMSYPSFDGVHWVWMGMRLFLLIFLKTKFLYFFQAVYILSMVYEVLYMFGTN